MFRRDKTVCFLTAWLAVLVQLHIFLVLELHHHVLGARLLRESARVGASWTRPQPAPTPAPLCPACQVVRVYIGQSTKIYHRETGEITFGRIPKGSVVVSGNLPSKDGKYSLYCAVIVKQVDAKTRSKVGINELLRSI